MLQATTINSEQRLRAMIERNLRKESHPGTKPSVDFIKKLLDDAITDGIVFDLTDMRPRITAFAMNSTNQAMYCIKVVQTMQFASETSTDDIVLPIDSGDKPLTFFDVEVYQNLFVICWLDEGSDIVVRMINPEPNEVELLFHKKLVGFNNRRYDNHILYARTLGYSNMDLYNLSQKIISNNRSAMFGNAYNISYADIYDFLALKRGLKLIGIELGMHHVEMDLPWELPVPDDMVDKVVDYCCNDVLLTQAAFHANKQDFVARQILADLSGLSVNSTTQNHTAKIVFGGDKDAHRSFVYTRLADQFPGYTFDYGTSNYRGEGVGEGGYIYAEPGMYDNVALLDVASMHPTSIRVLDLFGEYTKNYNQLVEARLAIKHGNLSVAKKMLGGKLAPYLGNPDTASDLAYALKIVINIVYGLTSAKFDNAFRDSRNIDNIVAKRGALFMIDLKHFVQSHGYTVAHIKTDSIKIPDADDRIIAEVMAFGKQYGYDFEHEATYDKLCLVNDAVYVAKKRSEKNPREWEWITVGAQFSHPFVYKTLFSNEPITLDDVCETRSVVKGAIYLDWEYDRAIPLRTGLSGMTFVGKTGRFIPVTKDGGVLYRLNDDKFYAVTGTKGYYWIEASTAKNFSLDRDVDMDYFWALSETATEAIEKFGSIDEFVKEA